ncbi:DUF4252 domain-containing protein [Sunxiuqinia sp. A32]|uniref:DUF4252 domain-containing protein n=1 Tax=Sunxiuqinia sp. A32 TaxID=3461496 RepID=UPI0040451E54
MKNIVYFIFALFLFASCNNDPAVDAAFSKYSGHNGIISITVPGFLIRTAVAFGDLEPAEKELLQNIDKVKVLAVDDEFAYPDVNFYNEFNRLIDDNSYTELMTVKEDGNNVKIMAQMADDEEIRNLIIMVGGENNALVFIKGEFTIDQIARVTNQYNDGRSITSLVRFN